MKEIIDDQKETIIQFVRYAIVGAMNTLVTLLLIYICKSLLSMNPWVSNAIGYFGGFINSFIWNKTWVFKSDKDVMREAIKFSAGFLICYGLQLLVTWILTVHTPMGGVLFSIMGMVFSGYGVATLIGMVVYTLANFVFNRLITFK